MENRRNNRNHSGATTAEKRSGRIRYSVARYTSFFTLIFLFSPAFLSTQEIKIDSDVDWLSSKIIFDLEAPLPEGSMNPSHRFQTEQHIESKAANMITEELGNITVDSLNKMSDLLYSDPMFYTLVEQKIASMNKTFSRSTPDMKHFTLRYTMPFYPFLIELFPQIEKARELDFFTPLDYRRESFTGIVIYAQDSYPLHGTDQVLEAEPALFPKLLTPDLEIIYEQASVSSEYLKKWGMVRYSRNSHVDLSEWVEQIGNKPLQLSARGLFGKYPSNIILSQEDCRIILANEPINHLLEQGKVLILLPPEM